MTFEAGGTPGQQGHRGQAEQAQADHGDQAGDHRMDLAAAESVEVDGRDERGADAGGELLHGAQRSTGGAGLVMVDVTQGGVEDRAEAGTGADANDEGDQSEDPAVGVQAVLGDGAEE